MDLHRRRSVLVRMTEDGRRLGTSKITNSPQALRKEIARAGKSPKVVLEATYGWYWAADTLAASGAEVHLAHPLGVKAFSCRRVKNDERDCADLPDLLRMGRLPEAWIAPHEARELRELTRYRIKLVRLRTSCKDQVHGVLAKLGVQVSCSDIFGTAGSAWLDGLRLPQPYSGKVTSLRHLAGELSTEITMLGQVIASLLAGDRGYQVIQQLPGIGPVLAAVIVAEIGEVTRFKNAARLCSWAGLTPRHRESGTKVTRGHVTKQGSRLLRWALIEAIQRIPRDCVIGGVKDAIIARRGKEARNIAKVAAARQLLTLVFYGMRDGQIRCLSRPPPRRRKPREHPTGTGARSPNILPPARREAANQSAPRPAAGRPSD
jgi:transposase